MTTVRFDTTQYEFSHGRKPRGAGWWAFRNAVKPDTLENVVFAPHCWTLSEAKKWAREVTDHAHNPVSGARILVVCP